MFSEQQRRKADINGDGVVNQKDKTQLQQSMNLFFEYDVDGDGDVDDKDYAEIVKIYEMFKVDIGTTCKS